MEDDYIIQNNERTQGGEKMLSYFDHLKTTQGFRDRIQHLKDIDGRGFSANTEYWEAVKVLCKDFKLLPVSDWSLTIDNIVAYDKWEVFQPFGTPDMCGVTSFDEIEYDQKFYKGKDPFLFKNAFPVLLGINPYASRQDIIDFIERTFAKRISPLLEKYKDEKIPINKIKKKSKSERDDFIFEHRNLSYADIDRLCCGKFEGAPFGYDYIGKIVRKEMKRRGVEE